ncbi:hypothetical protein [Micromonospora sp. NPDC006431]|uniref:hypothetical protein n=1 Tax=Micromonospora sp. NPDC006431 TaxID=3364235 RepID=UPI003699E06B
MVGAQDPQAIVEQLAKQRETAVLGDGGLLAGTVGGTLSLGMRPARGGSGQKRFEELPLVRVVIDEPAVEVVLPQRGEGQLLLLAQSRKSPARRTCWPRSLRVARLTGPRGGGVPRAHVRGLVDGEREYARLSA